METTEVIAELRKQGLSEAADRLESLDKRWKRTVVERDQARAMRERAERLLAELGGEIPYERLLEIAMKMHTWIFLHAFDEQEVYDELGLTDEENAILGYGGQLEASE